MGSSTDGIADLAFLDEDLAGLAAFGGAFETSWAFPATVRNRIKARTTHNARPRAGPGTARFPNDWFFYWSSLFSFFQGGVSSEPLNLLGGRLP